jgi:hypothetical protein
VLVRSLTTLRSDINYFVSSGSGFNPAVQNPISDGGSIQLNSSFAAGLYYFMSKWTSGAQTLMDFSDTPFTISNVVTQPSITVNSPNGGTFERYQPLVVSWNQSVAGKVFAEIRHESGTVSYPLANADYTAGIHSVTFDTSSIVGKFSANVSLTSAGGASVYDSSDSLFEIVQPPTPLLIAPTNPTSVVAGTPLKIQWSSSNPRITSVSLELRQYVSQCPMGSNCAAAPSTIIASTLSPTGEYTWTVPTPTPTQNTVSYRVIVCSNVRGCAGSSAFSITAPVVAQPSITITTPMGGENWPTGSIRRFSWTLGGGLDGNHYLGVSVTNVSTSAVVMSGTVLAGFGYLDWAVPQGVPSGSYRVTISDPLYTPTVSATSQPFTIGTTVVSPTITVTEPMNSYYAPQNVAVVWSSTGVIRVKIEVCHNSATTCTLVNANVPVTTAPSRYVWYVDVAGSYVGKNDVQAKVTDLDSGVSALGPVIRILAPVVVATGKPLACGMKGDVNGDGVISQADADAVRAHVLATTLLSSSAQLNADVNADGAVSTIDVSLITQYALGTTTTFPVCTSVTPTITVTQPFNSYYAPQNVAIVWSSTGVSRVKIEACYNTRATCVLVNGNVPVTAASSNYLWYLDTAASYVGKTDVQVKVTDLDSAAFGFGPAIQILAPVVTPTFDYSLGANANLTVTQGSTAANNITRTLLTGSAQAVTLTASGLPTGAAATFSNNPCVATCGSTLAITTSPTTPVGIYTITVTGQPLSKMTTFTFTVSTPTAPLLPISYSVTTDKLSYLQTEPISITIKAENPNSVSKTLNWNSGCQVGYAVAAYDSVTGQICTANLTSVTIPAYGSKTWTITHDPARYKIPAGVQTFTGKVIGYGSATVAVKISAPPVITAASASATLVDTSTDRVSSGTFGPGHANNQNPYDWHWKAEFALPAPKNVLGIVIPRKLTNILVSHPSLVESWSTLNTAYYPLVVVKGGTQVNSSYGAVIGDYTSSGSYALDLYGQPEYTSWLGGTVKFVFSDDTSVTGTIPASSIKQVSPVAFEGGTYVSASVIESFLSLLQDLK